MVSDVIRYVFIISLVLVLVAYWVGTKNSVTAFGTQITDLVDVVTGRNPSTGQFAAYPSGGGTTGG